MTGAEDTAEFARRLRELKDRSGRSYGMLAKRLHMSTSTLHRYCNGDAVPTEYAPVERFARVCGASAEELVSLHRAWVLADAARRRPAPSPAPAPAPDAAPAAASSPDAAPAAEAAPPAPRTEPESADDRTAPAEPATAGGTADAAAPGGGALTSASSPAPSPGRRRRLVASAIAAVAAVVLTGTLVVRHLPDDGGGAGDRTSAAGAAASPTRPPVTGSPSASPDEDGKKDEGDDKARKGATPAPSAATSGKTAAPKATGTPLTVTTRPHVWESPCSQHYLVNRPPAEMGPPPTEPDAPGWVPAMGAVASGDQMIALTVQASGDETVVLDALHVRVLRSSTPLPWNDYVMGVGCGGNVSTKSFDVRLDEPRPVARPQGGQGAFPYKVTAAEPLVVYVTGRASAHDVSWVLDLEWSSGGRSGTVRVDDGGLPFRVSGNKGRPRYAYPLGATAWEVPLD
ncbi:helix-turn-helix domain-containing protein [Streptomyces chilikensis]|uniref:Helix-turn-helix transcriptional regulator n=1 Tax=Streptomyces chilikensis TaxID=1194079 RepID=A0ABV3EIB5_9ACTN